MNWVLPVELSNFSPVAYSKLQPMFVLLSALDALSNGTARGHSQFEVDD